MNWESFIPTDLFPGDLASLIANIIRIMLALSGTVALIYLIYGGYQYVTSGGNAEQAVIARQTILNAIIGLIVIFASYAIISFVMKAYLQGSIPSPAPETEEETETPPTETTGEGTPPTEGEKESAPSGSEGGVELPPT